MYRLGLRLTLRSGREPFVRLLVTAAAVAVGVAIMLAVLADFHAFEVTNNRPSWETTQGQPVAADHAPAARSELWNYSNDIYAGQTIERLDVASLGPGAPVPPGISALPASGQYYASPALAALIRTVPRDELGDRFGGRLAGTIGRRALTGPDELVIYIGCAPSKLAGLPATMVVDRINAAPGRQVWSSYFRDAFIVGALAFLFPILILVGTATRLAAARREERYAALRLVGATSGQIGVIASVDALVERPSGRRRRHRDLHPAAACARRHRYHQRAVLRGRGHAHDRGLSHRPAGRPGRRGHLGAAVAASACASRRSASAAGSRRRRPRPWRIAPLLAGFALLILGLALTSRQAIGGPVVPGLLIILIGLVVAGPWLTAQAARLLRPDHDWRVGAAGGAAAGRQPARLPSGRSGGLVLAVFLGTVLAGLLPAVDSIAATPSATALHNVLLDGFTSAPVCGNNVNCNGAAGPGGAAAGRDRPPAAHRGGRAAPAGRGRDTASRAARVPRRHCDSRLLAAAEPGQGTQGRAVPARAVPARAVPAGRSRLGGPGPAPGPGPAVRRQRGHELRRPAGTCRTRSVRAGPQRRSSVPAGNLFDDNPQYSTQPIASAVEPGRLRHDFSGLYLQALLVKVNGPRRWSGSAPTW